MPAQPSRSDAVATVLSISAVAAVLSLALAVVALVVAGGSGDEDIATGTAIGAGATGETVTVDVALGDLVIEPSSIEVAAGAELVVHVSNAGAAAHDFKLAGEVGTGLLQPGQREEASLGIIGAPTEAWCTVPGHREAGMAMAIEVAGGGPLAEPIGTEADADEGAAIDFAAEPPADFVPFDPILDPAPGGEEHEITIHATEKVIEVAPGVTQQLWTFNDQVPGPTLRGRIGDLFTITLVNDGTLGHSIDFHASEVAWNDEMRTIEPGESLVYQFRATHSGIFMYHCGTPPALHHIGNGMFGAIVIDPPDLAAVDHEFVLVQSELYMGPDGEPGDLTSMQAADFDAVVFNGYVSQYKHRPIGVEPGESVRVWVLDAGPNENSAFHIVGTVFDTVYKEGEYQLRPGPSRGGSQALDLQPSQGGFVEFSLDEAGLYPIVTHKFANVGLGALGLFQAGDVEATAPGH